MLPILFSGKLQLPVGADAWKAEIRGSYHGGVSFLCAGGGVAAVCHGATPHVWSCGAVVMGLAQRDGARVARHHVSVPHGRSASSSPLVKAHEGPQNSLVGQGMPHCLRRYRAVLVHRHVGNRIALLCCQIGAGIEHGRVRELRRHHVPAAFLEGGRYALRRSSYSRASRSKPSRVMSCRSGVTVHPRCL